MTLDGADVSRVAMILRDVLGHDAGVTADDVEQIEDSLIVHGMEIRRVAARVSEPGEPEHPATQIGRILDAGVDLGGGAR